MTKKRSLDEGEHWCVLVANIIESDVGLQATFNQAQNTVSFAVRAGTRLTSEFFDVLPRRSRDVAFVLTDRAVQIVLTSKARRVAESALITDVPAPFEEHAAAIRDRLEWCATHATLRKLKPYKLVTQKAFRKLLVVANLKDRSRFCPLSVAFDYWLELGESGWMLVSSIEL